MKKLFLFAFIIALMAGCQSPEDEIIQDELQLKSGHKVEVCHYDEENDSWVAISVAEVAWQKAHMDHGDVLLNVDNDGDGYYPYNHCGINPREDGLWDCDDTDPYINPGMEEICGNDVDENCDGVIGEWNIVGEYTLDFNFGSSYVHIMDITSNEFSGTGYWTNKPNNYTWTVTGSIVGNDIEMTIVYDQTSPNPGYKIYMAGEIASDGSISGDATTSTNQNATWVTTTGTATCN